LAAALESGSSHPIAIAVLNLAAADKVAILAVDEARAIAGEGLEGRVDGRVLFLGAPRWRFLMRPRM